MPLVDWQAVVLDIQNFARTEDKTSFGQRELTEFIADRISEHRMPEGLPERVARLYLDDLVAARDPHDGGGRAAADANGGTIPSIDPPEGADEGVMPHGDRSNAGAAA